MLLLSAVIATAGVVNDSATTVTGAMIIGPLMTPILGVVLGVVTADRADLGRCLLLLLAGAAAVVALSWLLGHLVGVGTGSNSCAHLVRTRSVAATGETGGTGAGRDGQGPIVGPGED